MLSKLFFLNSLKERKKPKDNNTDELALVKAAAWAWYQHGSGSEAKAMNEFDVRRTRRETRPSRYKLEAMRMAQKAKEEGPSIHTKKPLLDTYEIQSISRQFDRLIESGHGHNKVGNGNNSINAGLDNSGRDMKKKKRISKWFWQRHGVVCGRRDDVVEGTALRGDNRLSSKPVPVVNLAKCLKANGAF